MSVTNEIKQFIELVQSSTTAKWQKNSIIYHEDNNVFILSCDKDDNRDDIRVIIKEADFLANIADLIMNGLAIIDCFAIEEIANQGIKTLQYGKFFGILFFDKCQGFILRETSFFIEHTMDNLDENDRYYEQIKKAWIANLNKNN